ncbi:MAG: STAS domain-containing protein [Nitrospirae bacterium]|nr:STAS domain-containing protein [Magnetococcales bacterium]HAT51497.1 anti-anti-sigma factor [Alphaproteobacteria bacterium]
MIRLEESFLRVVMWLPESFDFRLRREFLMIYQNRPPETFYKIDFRAVTSIDSSALGMLLLMRSYCGEGNARIRLVHCNERIRKILKTALFDEYFDMT